MAKKSGKFFLNEDLIDRITMLKKKLTTTPILAFPQDNGEFVVDTDARDVGLGAVISQVQDGDERVIAYASRALSKTEKIYCTTRKEMLALVYGVRWYTDSLRLENTEKILMDTRGSRHSLIIRSVEEKDFGNYTCQADNTQGKTKEHIVLSGAPHPVVFRSQSAGQARDSFNISWSVNSYSPIETYKLYYRRAQQGQAEPNTAPPTKKPSKKYNPGMMSKEWIEAVIPGDKDDKSLTHEAHFLIRRLEPKTEYEVKAQAKNRFGWSTASETFKFKTKGMDGIALDLTPEPAYHLPEVVMRDLGVTAKDAGRTSSPSIAVWAFLITALRLAV